MNFMFCEAMRPTLDVVVDVERDVHVNLPHSVDMMRRAHRPPRLNCSTARDLRPATPAPPHNIFVHRRSCDGWSLPSRCAP